MTDYTSWHVGMKVVCVKDEEWEQWPGQDPHVPSSGDPQYRKVYTVSEIYADDDGVFVALAEIDSWTLYAASSFRPAKERKTDISIFTAMLHDKKERAPA